MLEKRKMIHIKKSNVTTIISVLNWKDYQKGTEQDTYQSTYQSTEQSNTKVQTDKNVKNVKNEKNIPLKGIEAEPQISEKNEIEKFSEKKSKKQIMVGGDPEVNAVMDMIREITGLPPTSGQKSRNFASLLVKKMRKEYPDKDPLVLVRSIITCAKAEPWHQTKAHDPKHLYYAWQEIVAAAKVDKEKQDKNKIISF